MMNLFKLLLPAAFVAACAPVALAQQSQPAQQQPACKVKVTEAPALRGFRLGMTEAQVKERLPAATVNRDPLGLGGVSFNFNQLKEIDPAAYAGVGYVTLLFIDDRVTSISVQYDQTIGWKSTDHFAERVSELLKLPKAWRRPEGEDARQNEHFRVMNCDGFLLSVYPNFIRLLDDSHEATLARRREEMDEKRRQTFRP